MDATKHQVTDDEPIRPIDRYLPIWDKEIENMVKYGSDERLPAYIMAFEHLLKFETTDKINKMFKEFETVEDDHVALTKKMVNVGKKYYKSTYKEISEAGGLPMLMEQYKKKIEEQQKTIDKLQKKSVSSKNKLSAKSYDLPNGSSKNMNDFKDELGKDPLNIEDILDELR